MKLYVLFCLEWTIEVYSWNDLFGNTTRDKNIVWNYTFTVLSGSRASIRMCKTKMKSQFHKFTYPECLNVFRVTIILCVRTLGQIAYQILYTKTTIRHIDISMIWEVQLTYLLENLEITRYYMKHTNFLVMLNHFIQASTVFVTKNVLFRVIECGYTK